MAVEMQAGALTASEKPSLPEEITVAVPVERRLSIAALRGSPSQLAVCLPLPRLMFTAAMRMLERRAMTRSRPLIWSLVKLSAHGLGSVPQSLPVKREKTLIAITFANGATPLNDGTATRGDAGHVRAVLAVARGEGAGHAGADRGRAAHPARAVAGGEARLGHDPAGEEAVRLVDAGVEHRDVLVGAMAPERVRLGRLDDGGALGQVRCVQRVLLDAGGQAGPLERGSASRSSSSATDGIVSNVLTTRCFVPASAPTSRSRAPSIWAR